MNLVTSGDALVAASTCIVGLLLIMPRSNMRAAVRYTILMLRRGQDEGRGLGPLAAEPVRHVDVASPLDDRELVSS